jgi:hypothetical protein
MSIGLVGCGFIADNDIEMRGEHAEMLAQAETARGRAVAMRQTVA